MAALTLHARLDNFLPTLRVGIDFGEYTGGIALVRGTRVLHAETYLDFHASTLEQRRLLRRGRRTRHAKKMRLARLRSWLLRQRVNGKRFPDPYALMRDPRYMVQPGVYGSTGAQPVAAPSWVELAVQGKVKPAGFVRALTLLFQKRGYKWDAIALEEMNDAQLKDFLGTARVPSEALASDIRAQIDRRRNDANDPVRGRTRVPAEELEQLLDQARTRLPQPRVAEHRSVREDDLKAVVEGFGRGAGLPQATVETWKAQLVKLLNKALRLPRFENRLKSGCSWCGKATPRKAKVRELAYWAAMNNLRVRHWPQPVRTLNDEERQKFKDWWANREKAPGADSIKKYLLKIGTQKQMARQFYDLLKNPTPQGRASLCRDHLAMAAEGRTMKDAGVEWQTIHVRKAPNPCRESRDARILNRLEQILFRRGKRGERAWRFGQVGIITLEVPEPQTERAKKGSQKPREEQTLLDRLVAEFGGKCAYAILGDCAGPMDKDHIFPRSRGGPDVRVNLVPACKAHNEAKGDRTLAEWLGGNDAKWRAFSEYVGSLPIVPRKKEILINESAEYPDADPTSLARIGGRPRQFVVALGELFEKYGLPRPRLDYNLGEILVQRLAGGETARLRRSWLKNADGRDNFPEKDPNNLYNHAQDAALLAAAPPHTWRKRIYACRAVRPTWKGTWIEQGGLAVSELAPDWTEFSNRRTTPLLRILGRYPVTWKTTFADLTFGRDPEELEAKKLRISIPVENLRAGQVSKVVSAYWQSRLTALAQELKLGPTQTFPRAALAEKLPGLRRVQLARQPGGSLVRVRPGDGPARKVQIKPASEGIVVWQREVVSKGKTRIQNGLSVLRPVPLLRFGLPRIDPPVPAQARVLARFKRHQIIWLEATSKHPAGFYRLTKFQASALTAVAEHALPRGVALQAGMETAQRHEEDQAPRQSGQITLGKAELVALANSLLPTSQGD